MQLVVKNIGERSPSSKPSSFLPVRVSSRTDRVLWPRRPEVAGLNYIAAVSIIDEINWSRMSTMFHAQIIASLVRNCFCMLSPCVVHSRIKVGAINEVNRRHFSALMNRSPRWCK